MTDGAPTVFFGGKLAAFDVDVIFVELGCCGLLTAVVVVVLAGTEGAGAAGAGGRMGGTGMVAGRCCCCCCCPDAPTTLGLVSEIISTSSLSSSDDISIGAILTTVGIC